MLFLRNLIKITFLWNIYISKFKNRLKVLIFQWNFFLIYMVHKDKLNLIRQSFFLEIVSQFIMKTVLYRSKNPISFIDKTFG